ncbi:MAG: hypothetical protein HFJ28_01495 [Clostridia bacterium]|jgi:hypothetical protein|nr:hypothetical protein [Clostridia bacterium]
MKTKKKVMLILILIVLILLASNILATSNLVAQVKTSTNELEAGQQVIITFGFDKYEQIKKGINAFKAKLEYNKEIFEEVKQSDFQCLNDWEKLQYNQATGEFIAIKRAGSKAPEDLVSITLKTKQGVKATSTDIVFTDIVTSEGEKDINIVEIKTTINIIEDQTEKPEEPKQEKITSNKYTITENHIERILPNTSVAQFKANVTVENVTTQPQIVFTSEEGTLLAEDEIVTTGTKIQVGKTLQYTLSVIGDIDSDGKITINDLAKLKLHLIEKQLLEGIKLKSADINNDGKITLDDLAQMKLILIDMLKVE